MKSNFLSSHNRKKFHGLGPVRSLALPGFGSQVKVETNQMRAWRAVLALFLIFLVFSSASAQAATVGVPFPVDPTGRSGEPPTLPEELKPPTLPPGTLLPPAPLPPKAEPFPGVRVFVREIVVTGSTVFTAEELAQVTAPYVPPPRELTPEDLEGLRVALT